MPTVRRPRLGEFAGSVSRRSMRSRLLPLAGHPDPPTSETERASVARPSPTDMHSVAAPDLTLIGKGLGQVTYAPAVGAGFSRDVGVADLAHESCHAEPSYRAASALISASRARILSSLASSQSNQAGFDGLVGHGPSLTR
jgi:hypothetical protein